MERTAPTIIPSITLETEHLSVDRLRHPAQVFRHPDDVVADDRLDIEEKRAIRASWASDACAIDSMPALRRPPGIATPVTFDAVMDALSRLDEILADVASKFDQGSIDESPERLDA